MSSLRKLSRSRMQCESCERIQLCLILISLSLSIRQGHLSSVSSLNRTIESTLVLGTLVTFHLKREECFEVLLNTQSATTTMNFEEHHRHSGGRLPFAEIVRLQCSLLEVDDGSVCRGSCTRSTPFRPSARRAWPRRLAENTHKMCS